MQSCGITSFFFSYFDLFFVCLLCNLISEYREKKQPVIALSAVLCIWTVESELLLVLTWRSIVCGSSHALPWVPRGRAAYKRLVNKTKKVSATFILLFFCRSLVIFFLKIQNRICVQEREKKNKRRKKKTIFIISLFFFFDPGSGWV